MTARRQFFPSPAPSSAGSGGVDWSDALCRHVDGEIFYPGEGHADHADAAKAICRRCTLRNVCLEHALANKEKFGVWGGTTPEDRDAIWAEQKRKKRRKAAS
jgi:WhiB family redox-sensing transcriptional regulator